jgi:uncharacterized RDD family membrane protein YckC
MSAATESRPSVQPAQPRSEGGERFIGVVTRAVSWVIDAVLINVVAIMAGVGAALVVSIFPPAKNVQTLLAGIAGALYVIWAALYFITFWSMTGQTPGARVMQIRQVTAKRGRVKPVRALIRWIGMNLAMLPLFAGYLPLLFKRRGFPDWVAKTLVIDAPQLSLAEMASRAAQRRSAQRSDERAPEVAASATDSTDGSGDPIRSPLPD